MEIDEKVYKTRDQIEKDILEVSRYGICVNHIHLLLTKYAELNRELGADMALLKVEDKIKEMRDV